MADSPEIERAIRDFQSDGDREVAYAIIYQTYFRAVRGVFRRQGFGEESSEDLTQDTFVRVYRKLEDYEDRGYFGAWLFTITENVARHEWQRRKTLKRNKDTIPYVEGEPDDQDPNGIPAKYMPHSEPRQMEEMHDRQRRAIVDEAISELATRQRECLTLRLSSLSYDEIATTLRISRETVKQHLRAGRKHLLLRLADLDLTGLR